MRVNHQKQNRQNFTAPKHFFAFLLTKAAVRCYNYENQKTVEAEIKPQKTAQRARVAENRVGNCLANGPLRVQGNVIRRSIMQRMARVRRRGY